MHLSRFDQYYRIIERRVQEVLSAGALRITQKGLCVRTTIAMVPFHHLPILVRRHGR
jgi:hypothetical protein